MLNVLTEKDAEETTLALQGELSGSGVAELERCWRAWRRPAPFSLRLDLRRVVEIDASGKDLLRRMFSDGVQLVVGCRSLKTNGSGRSKAGESIH